MQRGDQMFGNAAQPEAAHHDGGAIGNDRHRFVGGRQHFVHTLNYRQEDLRAIGFVEQLLGRRRDLRADRQTAQAPTRGTSAAASAPGCCSPARSATSRPGSTASRVVSRSPLPAHCRLSAPTARATTAISMRRRHLRQVADRGHQAIVLFAVIGEDDRLGAKRLDELATARRTASGASGLVRNHGRPSNRSARASRDAGAAGHRVPADELPKLRRRRPHS